MLAFRLRLPRESVSGLGPGLSTANPRYSPLMADLRGKGETTPRQNPTSPAPSGLASLSENLRFKAFCFLTPSPGIGLPTDDRSVSLLSFSLPPGTQFNGGI